MENKKYIKINTSYTDLDCSKAYYDLSEIIKCKTISNRDQSIMDFNEFAKAHKYIDDNFPFIKKYGKKEVINKGSIYFTIEGADNTLPVALFMGHLDVVPPIKEKEWEFAPFSGLITDEYICGRGAIDMKCVDAALLNSIEYSLKKYGKPKRGILLCFGHDEETLGGMGQWAIKETIKSKKTPISFVLDEGGTFTNGTEFGLSNVLALNDVMEKGFMNVIIEGTSKGGHSSNPGTATALEKVAAAIYQITTHPFEPHLNEPLIKFLKGIEKYTSNQQLKKLISNIDVNPDMIAKYLDENGMSPLVKTTIAPTQIESNSDGANILPSYVKALLNLRLASSDSIENVKNHIKEVVKNIDVNISFKEELNASKISSTDSVEYNKLKEIIEECFDVIALPFISIGGTDCCFYNELCTNCFRFSPMFYDESLKSSVHGMNEKINKEAYIAGIKFYIKLIENTCY